MTTVVSRAKTAVQNARALRQVLHDGQLSRPELDRLVHRRLHRVLASAYQHVPYYRELMAGAGFDPTRDCRGPSDLKRLPVTTKSTVKAQGIDKMVREGSSLASHYSEDSSGTSGSPIRVYRAPYERALEIAKWLRVLFANGYSMRDRVMSISSLAELSHGHSVVQRFGLLRRRGVTYPQHSPEEMVDVLLHYKPDVLYANRCHLVLMALELKKRGVPCEGLKLLSGTGEVMSEGHRALFRQEFGVELVESYGSVEMGIMAYDTPERDGLHLCEDLTYFEFLDEDGRPVAPGVPGRVVVTDLAGELMPFIRYDQGDFAVYQECEMVGGSRARKITQIMGRDCDFIQLADGTVRPNMDATAPLKKHDELVQYQVIQRTHSRIDILVVADSSYLDAVRDELLGELHTAFPPDVRFQLIPVERIEPDSSGKIQPVVSEVGSQDAGWSPYGGRMGRQTSAQES